MTMTMTMTMQMYMEIILAKWTTSAEAEAGTGTRWTTETVSSAVRCWVSALRGAFYLADPTAAYGEGIPRGKARDGAGEKRLEGGIRGTDVDG